MEETSGHRCSPIKVRHVILTSFLDDPFIFTIACFDAHNPGERVGENQIQLCSWHRPGDDESIVLNDTSIFDITILSIVHTAIAGLPHPSRKLREHWGCLEELNGDGSLYAFNLTPIFNNHTAAGLVKTAMKLSNPTLFCVVYHSQQPNSTDGTQTPMPGVRYYNPLHDILTPPAKDTMDNIVEESDDDGNMRRPNSRLFPTK
jgi:hypothetical protein